MEILTVVLVCLLPTSTMKMTAYTYRFIGFYLHNQQDTLHSVPEW